VLCACACFSPLSFEPGTLFGVGLRRRGWNYAVVVDEIPDAHPLFNDYYVDLCVLVFSACHVPL
jgi:hypothetical protein